MATGLRAHDIVRVTLTGPCPNCSDPTNAPYCPSCGQRRVERRVSLRRMLGEAIEDQLSLNAALPRTVRVLLFRPGQLSLEYLAGRVQRFIPPFRLYLVTSVVFFLLLSFVAQREQVFKVHVDGELATDSTAAAAGADVGAAGDSAGSGYRWGGEMRRLDTRWPLLDEVLNRRLDELRRMEPNEAANQVGAEALRRAPTAMFLLLPIFAAFLKLLYIRRKRFYVDHFVFGLHTHAFAFVLFTIMLLASTTWVSIGALAWLALYVYLAMKRFYAQGWIKTLIKYGIMVQLYLVLLSFGISGVFMAALLLG